MSDNSKKSNTSPLSDSIDVLWEQTLIWHKQLVEDQLVAIGEDTKREGLIDTPKRVVKMWDEIYAGYKMDPGKILTTFAADGYDQMVILKDIELYSMCEHHMLPFFGKAHVASRG